jgi:hypothetical protein
MLHFINNLIYLTHSRLDISFVVSVISRFMQNPKESHWKEVKRIVCYLKGTTHFGIKYCRSSDSLVNFTDSNWAGDNDDRKSASSYVFLYSIGPLVWLCKKHKVVSLSTTKEEYLGTIQQGIEVVWIHRLLGELGLRIQTSTTIYCDNHSTIQVVDNLVAHNKMKHDELHAHCLI